MPKAPAKKKPAASKAKKSTPKGKAKKSTPKGKANKTSPKAPSNGGRAKKEGLRKAQERILKALAKKPSKGFTRTEIADAAPCDVAGCVEWIGSHDDGVRASNDAKHFPSLITLKLVRFAAPNDEDSRAVCYQVTAKGKQVASKIKL